MLLAAGGIIEPVQIEHEPSRRRVERIQELLDEQFPQAEQGSDVDRVLEPGQRRLRSGPGVVIGNAVADQLEHRIVPQRVVIVLVFIAGKDAVDPLADHRQQRVVGLDPRVGLCGGELPGQPNPLIELPHDEQPGITRQPARGILDDEPIFFG